MKGDFLSHIIILWILATWLSGGCTSPTQVQIPDVPAHIRHQAFDADSILKLSLERLEVLRELHSSDQRFPRSWDAQKKQLITDPPHVWTVGFYPGLLWKAYFMTGDSSWHQAASRFVPALGSQATNTSTHDLGFMLFLGLGRGKDTSLSAIQPLLEEAARSLYSRFDPQIGAIKSYDSPKPEDFPVIIDNLINLELLLWAGEKNKDSTLTQAAIRHGDFTRVHFIEQGHTCSTHHKVIFSAQSGKLKATLPGQGASAESVWSRGLAWGIYGYTMLFRYLEDSTYLNLAGCMADYWLSHIPNDGIPYWDFEAKHIPKEPRDAAAAAITASALLELSGYLPSDQGQRYQDEATNILKSLCSPTYFLPAGKPFILDHSTLSVPHKIDVDQPQTMADYYFIEALGRYP